MSKQELVDLATEKGIDLTGEEHKKELIELIEGLDTDEASSEEETPEETPEETVELSPVLHTRNQLAKAKARIKELEDNATDSVSLTEYRKLKAAFDSKAKIIESLRAEIEELKKS